MPKPTVIILGAGRPARGEKPSALVQTSGNRRVLDWIIEAFSRIGEMRFHFVGGYRVDSVIQNYPHINFTVNANWQKTGSAGSLLVAPITPGQMMFVCYADVVFSSRAVKVAQETPGDVVLVVDHRWRDRYESRSLGDMSRAEKVCVRDGQVLRIGSAIPVGEADAEFTGLLKLSPRAVEQLATLHERNGDLAQLMIPGLIEELLKLDLSVRAVDIAGDWAELNAPQDLAHFVLGTKAETLHRLRPLVRRSSIGDQVSFTLGTWQTGRDRVLGQIQAKFGSQLLAVRSSALSEDNWSASNAGAFTSVLNVPGDDAAAVVRAIERVLESYGDQNPGHQILVQAMIVDVKMSGVVFTRSLNYGAPYYVLNFDDQTASTESVTNGKGRNLRTVFVHRSDLEAATLREPAVSSLLGAVRELEELVGHDSLDIEFVVTTSGQVHILQLRPIAVEHETGRIADEELRAMLENARRSFEDRQRSGPFLVGRRTCFGVMPDWNPAEIVGTKPGRLALTLYQYLITDDVWARQRAEYGNRDVRPQPLLVSLAGHPYVDVRATFNSFIPASVPDPLAARLVDHYLDRLESHPHLHDKVEFDIVYTCLTFDFTQRSQRLLDHGFSPAEVDVLRRGLACVTRGVVERTEEFYRHVEVAEERYWRLASSDLADADLAHALLEDCRRYGTLPFAHLARAGFVAVSLLRSLEAVGVTSPAQTAAFLNSLHTVARAFEADGVAVGAGRMEWETFESRYGHLRPGTYDITSPCYAAEPERFLRPMTRPRTVSPVHGRNEPVWDAHTRLAIGEELRKAGLPEDVDAFERFLRRAIEGREYSKFIFTRNVSAALEAIARFGAGLGLGREQLAHISLQDLLAVRKGAPAGDIAAWLTAKAEEGLEWYRKVKTVELPPLIMRAADLFAFELPHTQPNFITGRRVTAELVHLAGEKERPRSLKGMVVLIPQADPGFDWVFAHEIGGLITMYGGANSHMAIRAAEFSLPAAIGVGQVMFEQLSGAQEVDLDCAARRIRVLR